MFELVIRVVDFNGNRSSCDACLAVFVDQVGESMTASHLEFAKSKNENNSVEDVWFAAAIKAGDGIERLIKASELHSSAIWLESIENYFGDEHGGIRCPSRWF